MSPPTIVQTPVHRGRGIVALSLVTVIWGLVPLVFKETDMPVLAFATYRLWMGVLVYAVVFAVTGRRVSLRTLKLCALGGVFFACDVALSFAAFRLTSVANATIIGALAPVFITLVAARWFGERVQRRDLVMVAASFAGVALVALGSRGSPSWSPAGDAFALASVVSWTCYWLFSKRARTSAVAPVGALEYMASVMTVAAVVMTVLALAFGQSLALPTRRTGAGSGWSRSCPASSATHWCRGPIVTWRHGSVRSSSSACRWSRPLPAWCSSMNDPARHDRRHVVVVVATGVILAGSRRRDRLQGRTETFEEPETPAPAG